MLTVRSTQSKMRSSAKYWVFGIIAAMMAYVLYHNERFLIDPMHPIWQHYRRSGCFCWHMAWQAAAHSFSRRCNFPSA